MRKIGSFTLVSLALIVTSCGGSQPESDEQFIQEIGFNTPISISVELNQLVAPLGRLAHLRNSYLLALLADAGYLKPVRNSDPGLESWEPRWRFSVLKGSAIQDRLDVQVGRRVIAARSEQRTWSEGPIEYFAETITYNVAVNSDIEAARNYRLSGLKFRLVVRNDPAIGHWSVDRTPDRGTNFSRDDALRLEDDLAIIGIDKLAALEARVQEATKTN